MTSSTLALPSSRLPRCLASCTKPFPRLYLQLNTTKVILYDEVSDISDEYNKKRSITHSVSHPSSLHLIIAFDGSFKESTTSPQRHPFKVSSMCFLGTRFRLDRPVSSTIASFSVLTATVLSMTRISDPAELGISSSVPVGSVSGPCNVSRSLFPCRPL